MTTETNAERVTRIREGYNFFEGFNGEDLEFIFDQAEKVQVLEEEIKRLRKGIEVIARETSCDDTWDYAMRLLDDKLDG